MIILILSILAPILISKYYEDNSNVKIFGETIIILVSLAFCGYSGAISTYLLFEVLYNSTQKYLNGEVWYEDTETWFGRVILKKFGALGCRILFAVEVIISLLTFVSNA